MSSDSNQIIFYFKDYKSIILYLVIKEQTDIKRKYTKKGKVFSLKKKLIVKQGEYTKRSYLCFVLVKPFNFYFYLPFSNFISLVVRK